MSDFKIKAANGEYEFILRVDGRLDIIHHGGPWGQDMDASKALYLMMAELDAARGVLSAARRVIAIHHEGLAPIGGLLGAIERHDRLIGNPETPKEASALCV